MSRNKNVLFTDLPKMDIQRSIIDMPQNVLTSFNVGELVPFFVMEMLPSDSVQIRTNKLVRVQTFMFPVMDNLVLDCYYFFCPNRLVWTHWKQFMGENTESAYLPQVEYTPPRIICGDSNLAAANPDARIKSKEVLDYLGLPVQVQVDSSGKSNELTPIAFPYRSYQLIWNEFFRDQNLQNPVNINTGDSDTYWKDVSAADKKLLPVAKTHDYFTSALLAPAKVAGGSISAPVSARSSSSPVITGAVNSVTSDYSLHGQFKHPSQSLDYTGFMFPNQVSGNNSAEMRTTYVTQQNPVSSTDGFFPDNLRALHTNIDYNISIPDLRLAFQMQKFLEREASHGSRYQETILAHFNCVAQDARLQRPEYLGGNRIPLSISQVINQSQTDSDPLGDVGGMSVTSDSHFDVEFSCQEHGFIIGVCCARIQRHMYPQGMEPWWYRTSRYDYYWPEFSHLTDQAARVWSINAEGMQAAGDSYGINSVFGYTERYSEYKFRQDKVTGEMRPGITNSLAAWHFADYYGDQLPRLSDGWIREDKTTVDRTLEVTSEVANQIFGNFYIECRATRPMPVHSNPGLADHF